MPGNEPSAARREDTMARKNRQNTAQQDAQPGARQRGARQRAKTIGVAVAGAGVFLGSLAGTTATMLARQVVNLPRGIKEPVRVLEVRAQDADASRGLVRLARSVESTAPGQYTLVWDDGAGRARLGAVVGEDARSVTREFSDSTGAAITATGAVRVTSAPQLHVRDLGLPYSEVAVPGELGAMPGWFIPAAEASGLAEQHGHIGSSGTARVAGGVGRADRGDWVIHVHGRGSGLTEPLRVVPLVHAAGWHSLVTHYRGDVGAPPVHPAKYGLGLTEWRDVDAALEWALARGAKRFVLVGWSMGGAIVAQTYLRSAFADRIVGLVLESPAVRWREILEFQADQLRVPRPVTDLGIWLLRSPLHGILLGTRQPLPVDELDLVARADEFQVPVLLLHGTGDTVVPVDASREFAAARPDLVTYEEFPGARHTRLWNLDAARWERAVRAWFAQF